MKTTLPLKETYGLGEIDVTIINTGNNKSVKTFLEIDTGGSPTKILSKFSRILGLDVKRDMGVLVRDGDFYLYPNLLIKIGNLKPFKTPVMVPTGKMNMSSQVLGMYTLSQFKKVSYNSKFITFEDYEPTPEIVKNKATYTTPIQSIRFPEYTSKVVFHDVTFYNRETGKPIIIEMEVDSGTEIPLLPVKYATRLGIDIKDAVDSYEISDIYSTGMVYVHVLTIKIGNLKPITTKVGFDTRKDASPLLGLEDILKKVRFEIAGGKLSYIELAALGEAHKSFYGHPRWSKRI